MWKPEGNTKSDLIKIFFLAFVYYKYYDNIVM